MSDEQIITAPQIGGAEPVGSSELSDFASPFLENVPANEREIVGKYVKEWDGQVTKKFQDYSSKLKTYEEFGDPENIQTAISIMSQLSANPIEFIQRTQEYINENPELFEEFMAELEEQSQEPVGQDDNSNYVDRAEFESMRQQLESFQEDQETQEQLRILDNVMDQLHNDHGSFNDDYVLLRISQGMSPEEAVQSWEQEATQFIDSRKSPTAPRLLSGQGGTPLDQVDKSKLKDPAFRKEYGAELLKAQFGR